MRSNGAGISDVGLQREHNEDCFAVLGEYELYVVADGMGGHRAGDVASRLASEAIADFFKRTAREDVTWPFHFDSRLSDEENRLVTAIRVANRQIYEHSVRSRDLRGMGTTIVGALFSPDKNRLFIGHVGDSRAYRIRAGAISQLTQDHSLVNDYLAAMPDMSEEQRNELPKNVITRALGMQDNVDVDIQSVDVLPGDIFVLCSDGLSGMVDDDQIKEVVLTTPSLEDACRRLIRMANEHGGEDNITAVIFRVDGELKPTADLGLARTQPLQVTPPAINDANGSGPVEGTAPTPPGPPVTSREQVVTDPAPAGEVQEAERRDTQPLGTPLQPKPDALEDTADGQGSVARSANSGDERGS